jgi:hypothetical protein
MYDAICSWVTELLGRKEDRKQKDNMVNRAIDGVHFMIARMLCDLKLSVPPFPHMHNSTDKAATLACS